MGDKLHGRLVSIDILRGIVIVLMAIDHTRDFWAPTAFQPEDLTQSSPAWFFTRWITHFCAPIFVFLAGTSAFLYGNKQTSKKTLSWFLFSRGLWLVILELLIINPSWQAGFNFLFVQVIWALGWSMICLAGLIWLPRWVIGTVGLVMVFGHNLTDSVQPQSLGAFSTFWQFLHVQSFAPLGQSFGMFIAYPLIPWIGVMALGYCLGSVFLLEAKQRNQILIGLGLSLILLFIGLRSINLYGDAAHWAVQDKGFLFSVMSFLNTTKYPPSLLFLCMTLGPALLILPALEGLKSLPARILLVFGQVPLFFYILHIPVIHFTAYLRNLIQYGEHFTVFTNSSNWPADYSPSVLLIYIAWIFLLLLLYFPCRWYRDLKMRSKKAWMSYI